MDVLTFNLFFLKRLKPARKADHEEALPDSALEAEAIHESLMLLLENLNWRERFIPEMSFGIGREQLENCTINSGRKIPVQCKTNNFNDRYL